MKCMKLPLLLTYYYYKHFRSAPGVYLWPHYLPYTSFTCICPKWDIIEFLVGFIVWTEVHGKLGFCITYMGILVSHTHGDMKL